MSKTIANCTLWLDSVAIASQVNQVTIEQSAAELDITNFSNVGQARLGGLKDGVISAAGFWEANPDPDFTIFGDVGSNVPVTVALARSAPVGTVAYLMNALLAEYGGIGAKVGNPLAFSLKCGQGGSNLPLVATTNSGRLAQGVLAINSVITAAGSSAVYGPLPAPVLLQSIVASVHVIGAIVGGGTFSLSLSSSASISMTSPTVRATFGAPGFTTAGSDIAEIPGPITDTYWQFNWNLTGTSPSATVAAALGNAY